MAKTRTVYSTQDDGAGTLRDALRATASYTQEWIDAGALENGDVIDFSAELEVNGVITILLSAQLFTPTRNISIDGGEHTGSGATLSTRVVLDAQGTSTNDTWRIMNGPSTSGGSVNINGVTFKNGYHDASGYFGGGFNARNSNENVFSYCVFESCGAKSGAGVYGTTDTINTFNNCVFKNNNAFSSYGGGAYSYNGQMSFNNCHFINNNANAQGGAVYVNSTLGNTFNSCIFDGNTANNVGDLYVNANSLITFSGSQTLDTATVGAGASVTFTNNAELFVTTSATIGTATFSAASGDSASATFPAGTSLTSATWTNVATTLVVNSNLDDGTGTLRNALTNAVSGTTITFDDALEVDGVITIILSSALDLPNNGITIDGGEHTGSGETLQTRVILSADAGADNEFKIIRGNVSNICTLNNLTFQNGYVPSGTNFGAGLQIRTGGYSITNYINYCVFKNNEGGTYGGGAALYAGVAEFNNCVFDGNKAINGAAVLTYQQARATLNNCWFVNNNNTSGSSGCVYAISTSLVVINNCIFNNNTGRDISDNSTRTSDSLIATGTNAISGSVYISGLSKASFSGYFTCRTFGANNSATITFSGVDSVLAVTDTARIGSAMFTAAAEGATGYAAFPENTDISAATFSGVKTATYGAGASDFHAQITSSTTASLGWSQTDSDVPVLLEAQESESDTWTTLSTSATSPYTVTDDDIDDLTFRIFDGESFYTAVGSYTFAKFYQVVAGYIPRNNDTTPHSWQTVIKLLTVNEMNENLKPGQDCAILARVYDAFDNDSPLLNLGSNISSVYYTCEKKTKGLYTTEWSPVTGHNNVSAGADCVLSSLQTDDAWDIDNVGYNFLLSPEISTHPLFETAGLYRIKATINPVDGDPITFYKEINVVE